MKLICQLPFRSDFTSLKILFCDKIRFQLKSKAVSCCKFNYYTTSPSYPKEIYYGVLTPQIKGVKVFSLGTSVTGVISQPVLYQQVANFGGGLSLTIFLGSCVGFFTFVTPFLLHTITKKYVTKIVYCPKDDTYSATTLSFFLKEQNVVFRPQDVEVPDIPGVFTSFHIKGRPVFVDPRLFTEVNHYAKIMGYDKPMDFKLGDTPESQTPPKS